MPLNATPPGAMQPSPMQPTVVEPTVVEPRATPSTGSGTPRRLAVVAVSAALVFGACSSSGDDGTSGDASAVSDQATPEAGDQVSETEPVRQRYVYPDPPVVPDATVPNSVATDAIDRIAIGIQNGSLDADSLAELRSSGDARHAWFISDLLRFLQGPDSPRIVATFEDLTGVSLRDDPDLERSPWLSVTNHLIAWDTPDYDGYQEDKATIFTQVEEGWTPFFTDADAAIDWRYLSWGGVFIDDRPVGDTAGCPGGCIPSLDDPATTDAAGGSWYSDDRTVFGITVDGESLAIPLNIAEIHEMFNLDLGDRRLAIPYCTLCGSAQAYFTDQADGAPVDGAAEIPVLRTSGLLTRSNKVMYDLVTSSVFDTFTGAAVSGPLQDSGVVLPQITVVRSTWAEWKLEYPDTQIIAEDGGIGRSYRLDPLGSRDDNGPIFPVGDVDARLGVQEFVVGVVLDDGTTIAFPSDAASATLGAGDAVEAGGVELRESGDGLVALDADTGDEIAVHEAFWFAWSQFHPDTLVWEP